MAASAISNHSPSALRLLMVHGGFAGIWFVWRGMSDPSQRAPLWDPPHLGCLPGMVPDTACRMTGVSPIGLHTSRCYSGHQRLPTRCTERSHRLSCWSHRSSPKLMCARESTQAFHALTTWNTDSGFSSLGPDKGY